MYADEVARLCASMTLKDRKVLSPKMVHRDGFRAVMKKIWQTREGVEIDPIDGNIFTFQFGNTEDKQRIVSGGPWSFNDALIVMEEPRGLGDVHNMKFNKSKFWVQIHNAPLICMSEEIGRFLRSMIGDVVDFDGGDPGSDVTNFLRVRVLLEIDKPLRRCLRIDVLGDGVESVMLIKYERLLDFCFRCGLLGHTTKDCPDKPKSLETTKEDLLFGFWMRVVVPYKGGFGGRRWTADSQSNKELTSNRGSWRNMSREGASREDGRKLLSVEVVETGGIRPEPCLVSRPKGKVIADLKVIDSNTGLEGMPDFLDNPKLAESYGLDTLNLNSNRKRINSGTNIGVSLSGSKVGSAASTCPMIPSNPMGFTGLLNSGSGLVQNPDILTKPIEAGIRHGNYIGDPIHDHSVACSIDSASEVSPQQCVFGAQNSQFTDENPSLISKWKRRARNQHRLNNSGTGGPVLGKKKEIGGNGGTSDVQKKQRLVSSFEDSADAGLRGDGLQGTVWNIRNCTKVLDGWNKSNRRQLTSDIQYKRNELKMAT
ncbi:hypothetical protein EZV62_024788 [Acer yangbiense]|uniref:CCHC-type domain-containing protein n=1 Tax=Acer yangbiense TaxID=1000413 RepID=A0A5C7GW09_9ROSI|nr:hypothetical protein EZV62_024788 [Acer yangbiense]